MKLFVLDGSILIACCMEDEQDDYADFVLHQLENGYFAYVPNLWHLEVGNVLLGGKKKNRISKESYDQYISRIPKLPVKVDPFTDSHVFEETIHLAEKHGLTTYDASYLELAMRLSLPIATLDKQLKKAAEQVGVPTFK